MPPAARQAMTEPASPSQVFFGLITGAIGCLPNEMPAKYPPTSLHTVRMTNTRTRYAPSGGASMAAMKTAISGRYAKAKAPAVTSRT